MGFVFVNAPNPRFGAGYLALCPALFAAVAGPGLESWSRGHLAIWHGPISSNSLASILLGLAALLALQTGLNDLKVMRKVGEFGGSQMALESHSWHRLLLPPALPRVPGDLMVLENRRLDRIGSLQVAYQRSKGIEYWRPIGTDQCWAVLLPCLPDSLGDDVRLRRPDRGFRSGFTRTSYPENAEPIR